MKEGFVFSNNKIESFNRFFFGNDDYHAIQYEFYIPILFIYDLIQDTILYFVNALLGDRWQNI